jgi:CheY-like chemotaxis protein
MLALEGKRIFIVEDILANRAIVQLMLEHAGAKVGFERWGTETTKKLKLFMPVDLILLDLMLPNGITGYSVFTDIRAYPEFRHIPIVAVSASDPTSAIRRQSRKRATMASAALSPSPSNLIFLRIRSLRS